MLTLLLVSWLLVEEAPESWIFPVFDSLEQALMPIPNRCQVGQIFIIGNDRTRHSVILDQLPLYSGTRLYVWRMALAELRLVRLGLFEVNPMTGIRPHVTAIDRENDNEFKDIKVEVVEKQKLAR